MVGLMVSLVAHYLAWPALSSFASWLLENHTVVLEGAWHSILARGLAPTIYIREILHHLPVSAAVPPETVLELSDREFIQGRSRPRNLD